MEQIRKSLDEEKAEIKKIWKAIREINVVIARIETKIDSVHICKYNGKVGELVEFKEQSGPIRNNIYHRLDKNEEEVEHLKGILIELRAGTKYLEDIKREQKMWLMGIAGTVIAALAVIIYKTAFLGI